MENTTKVKHTDEPWEMLPLEELQIGPNKRECYQIIGHHNAVLAIVIADTWYSISGEANAHLISAAPELLEALKELSEAIDYGRDHTPRDFQRFLYGQPGSGFTHAAIRKAKAAISKATGGAL
jgi:hypothetical protein